MQTARFLHVCERAARAGGQVLLDLLGQVHPREKGPRDLVTEADIRSQEVIREIVLGEFPDHLFLGEEESADPLADLSASEREQALCWVVDPLDGTTNFVHRLPSFAVSIALEQNNDLLAGVVFDPVANECYAAAKGRGASLNGQRLEVSQCRQLRQALVATGFSPDVQRGSLEIEQFVEMLTECQGLRRLGSAALNCCYLAAGRLDGYWATSVKKWDVAAGVLILLEAGGQIQQIDKGPFQLNRPQFVAAATPELSQEMFDVLGRACCSDGAGSRT
ncbi:inositol monophosphatase family protein [Lignipirellula cremea]|uniref:Inositol-1-monophosphatase n=1 Tax=Lignipirellula cremea TaxID=2528010 RepID=A0A518DN20_9BACT|nr:inositol monophosphatase family protein [Lignipirellula cremea]QDU93213.1 Inositol-1-monophosphatase [Lignipirellula cremea]